MLESLLINLQTSRLATLLKRDFNTGVFLWILLTLRTPISKNICERLVLIVVNIMHRKLNKIIQEVDWPSRLAFCFFWNIKSLYFAYSHSHSFVLSLAVTHCHFLLLVVFCCHSLSLAVPLVVTRCDSLYHSLSFTVPLNVTRCHLLSFNVTRCHSLYHLLSFVVTLCHSMSLDVPLVCLFINDHYFIIFCFLDHL